jgi:O-antigen/teichoic acid export membrane protein
VRSSQAHFQIRRRFRLYAITDLFHSFFRFGGTCALLAAGAATPASVLSVLALGSFAVAAATLVGPARPILRVAFSPEVFAALMGKLRLYLGTVVVGSVIGRMDLFLVSSLGRVSDAGLYAAAQLFALLPQLLGIYMAAVFSPRVLPLWRKGEFAGVYGKFQVALLGLAGVAYLAAVFLVNAGGGWLLPAAYQPARTLILYLLPAGLAAMVAFPWAIPFLLYTRAKTLLALDCLLLPVLACGYAVLIPRYGAQGAALLTSGAMVLRSACFVLLANHILRTDPGGESWSLRNQSNPTLRMAGEMAGSTS